MMEIVPVIEGYVLAGLRRLIAEHQGPVKHADVHALCGEDTYQRIQEELADQVSAIVNEPLLIAGAEVRRDFEVDPDCVAVHFWSYGRKGRRVAGAVLIFPPPHLSEKQGELYERLRRDGTDIEKATFFAETL